MTARVYPHQAYIDEVSDRVEQLGFDVRYDWSDIDGTWLMGSLLLEFDNLPGCVYVLWNQYDGWQYRPEREQEARELLGPLMGAPSLVASAVHQLLTGSLDSLPMVDDPDRPAPAWDGQEEFEAAVAAWNLSHTVDAEVGAR